MAKKHKFTPEQVADVWETYKYEADNRVVEEASAGKIIRLKRPRVYTLESFLTFLGLSRQAWSEYAKHRAYRDVVRAIDEEVFARKKEALVNQEGSTTGLIFDMKANYGINDKTIIDASIDGTYVVTMDLGGPKNDNEGTEEDSV